MNETPLELLILPSNPASSDYSATARGDATAAAAKYALQSARSLESEATRLTTWGCVQMGLTVLNGANALDQFAQQRTASGFFILGLAAFTGFISYANFYGAREKREEASKLRDDLIVKAYGSRG